jgi:exosome complex RNA-binding protein Csl4
MRCFQPVINGSILSVILAAFFAPAAVADSSDLVKGFAKYQAGRVENIVLDAFIYDLANEKYLQQFFPDTSNSINEYDSISGKRLIPLLSYYVKKDLESLETLARCVKKDIWAPIKEADAKQMTGGDLTRLKNAFNLLDWLMLLKKEATYSIKDYLVVSGCIENSVALNKIKENFKPEGYFIGIIEEFLNKKDKVVDKTKTLAENVNQSLVELVEKQANLLKYVDNSFLVKGIDFPGFMAAIESINMLNGEDAVVKDNKVELDSRKLAANPQLGNTVLASVGTMRLEESAVGMAAVETESAMSFLAASGISEAEDRIIERNSEKKSYAVYVHQLTVAMHALGFQVDDREGFQKFKSASLFLASLAEAAQIGGEGGADAVAGVIDDFVNEEVVYKNKRNSVALYTRRPNKQNLRCSGYVICKNTWFLGSYYGVSIGKLDKNTNGDKQTVYRAFGPIGVEFKIFSGPMFGKDVTVTLMAAPVDIGIYITDELNGSEYDVSIDDITAPSYFISFASKRSPMAVQLGYQEDIPVANNRTEKMVFMALSFDLPLVTLW